MAYHRDKGRRSAEPPSPRKRPRIQATIWVEELDRLNNALGNGQPGIRYCIGLSATPFYIEGSRRPEGCPFPRILSDFGLVDTIESGLVKIPRLPVQDTTGRPDPKYFKLWEAIKAELQPAEFLPTTRQAVATVGRSRQPGEHLRCVVSVAMLTEGWDARNMTEILGLRAFGSQLLCEQVVGRGLRRMDCTPDLDTGLLSEESVDVYGIPFSVIPFKGRPVKKPEPGDKPKNHVRALPDRAGFEMRFPIVEG